MATSRKVVLLFGVENLNAILGWIAIMLVARRMGAGVLGELAYALSLVGGFSFLAFLGFRIAHVKRVSEGMDLGRCTGTFLTIRLALIALMLLTLSLAWWVWTGLLGKQLYDLAIPLLLVIVAYWVVQLLAGVMLATFTGRQEGARVAWPAFLGTTTRSLLLIALALWASERGALGLAQAYLAGIVITALVALWYFRDYPMARPDRATFDSYTRYALPVAIASICGVLRLYADKVVVGVFWDPHEVGLYFGVERIALFLGTIALALEAMLLPSISELYSKGATAEAAQAVSRAERYTAMFALPAVMLTIVWAAPVILVFISREFLPAAPILQLLCLVALLRVLNRPWSVALRGADRPGLASQVSIVATCIGLVLMLLLVPRSIPHIGLEDLPGLGGQGAALALLGTEFFVLVALRWLCYTHLGMSPSLQLLRQVLATLLVGALLWQVASIVVVARWYELFGLALLGGTLYFALLALLGGLTHRDLRYLWHAFHPREMGSYVRDELRR
ncbi:MAG: oligosaccharide flippase family protein [Candidatus Thermoplasmatota archaeon]|nr:oligosaccharide flippase family protein [Candidatus Thermoplasmatota archaeon]